MINEKDNIKLSKFLSLVLRHQPELIGIELDENGWVNVEDLLKRANVHGNDITLDILDHIVDTNSKKRFAFSDDKLKIRASQGHSVNIDLDIKQQTPPSILYHGTGAQSVKSILETGLEKRSRQHVHLSKDIDTAVKVGQRHGKPVVFEILALEMHNEGYQFFLSDNGVWLVNDVPPRFLKLT